MAINLNHSVGKFLSPPQKILQGVVSNVEYGNFAAFEVDGTRVSFGNDWSEEITALTGQVCDVYVWQDLETDRHRLRAIELLDRSLVIDKIMVFNQQVNPRKSRYEARKAYEAMSSETLVVLLKELSEAHDYKTNSQYCWGNRLPNPSESEVCTMYAEKVCDMIELLDNLELTLTSNPKEVSDFRYKPEADLFYRNTKALNMIRDFKRMEN